MLLYTYDIGNSSIEYVASNFSFILQQEFNKAIVFKHIIKHYFYVWQIIEFNTLLIMGLIILRTKNK